MTHPAESGAPAVVGVALERGAAAERARVAAVQRALGHVRFQLASPDPDQTREESGGTPAGIAPLTSGFLAGCNLLWLPALFPEWLPLALAAMVEGVPVLLPENPAARAALPLGGMFVSDEHSVVEAGIRRLLHPGAEREAAVRRARAEARRQRHQPHLPPHLRRAQPLLRPVRPVPPPYPGYRRLSVVIACHDQQDLTAQCIASLRADVPDAEVVLVDNGSRDGTAAWARAAGLQVLSFRRNRGVAPAWNAGLGVAAGDLLCVLNNDTLSRPGGMQRLARAAWRTGIAALQGGVLSAELGCVRLTGTAGESDYPDGCALLFRRDVWEAVGPFDEGMERAYCEDSDWGLRARSRGFNWELVPDALVHLGGRTAQNIRDVPRHHRRNEDRLRLRWGGKGLGERIKVRRWGMLGDVLMLTPALAALRKDKPFARIHLQCAPEIADLLRGLECVDAVDSGEFPTYTETHDLDHATWELEQAGEWRHPSYVFADRLGVPVLPQRYAVPDVAELDDWARTLLPGTGYIACGLRSEKRDKANWGEAAWRELCRHCPGYRFVLLDREPHPPLEPRGETYFGPRAYEVESAVDLTGRTPSLRHVLAVLRRCTAAVCVDSGLFHLASAAGLPVVGLMGGAPGWARQPLAGNVRIFQGEAPCYPCSDPHRCRRTDGGPHCLEWVTPARVATALQGLLAGKEQA
jgi:GT2 family glycosyltransferase